MCCWGRGIHVLQTALLLLLTRSRRCKHLKETCWPSGLLSPGGSEYILGTNLILQPLLSQRKGYLFTNMQSVCTAQVFSLPGLELVLAQRLEEALTFPWAWNADAMQLSRLCAVDPDGQVALVRPTAPLPNVQPLSNVSVIVKWTQNACQPSSRSSSQME